MCPSMAIPIIVELLHVGLDIPARFPMEVPLVANREVAWVAVAWPWLGPARADRPTPFGSRAVLGFWGRYATPPPGFWEHLWCPAPCRANQPLHNWGRLGWARPFRGPCPSRPLPRSGGTRSDHRPVLLGDVAVPGLRTRPLHQSLWAPLLDAQGRSEGREKR